MKYKEVVNTSVEIFHIFNIYNNSVVSFILAMLFYLIFNVLVFLRTSNIVHYILHAKINKIVAIKRKNVKIELY